MVDGTVNWPGSPSVVSSTPGSRPPSGELERRPVSRPAHVVRRVGRVFGIWLGLVIAPLAAADNARGTPPDRALPSAPSVAIIIDDIGYRKANGRRAAMLPGALTYAVLPHTPHAKSMAQLLYRLDREVIIHMPMEPDNHHDPGPGAILTSMKRADIEQSVRHALASVPHARGISNHMGSRATADVRVMDVMMGTVAKFSSQPLFFLDSRTTAQSVTRSAATEHDIPHLVRDVFLDNVRQAASIRAQLGKLVAAGLRKGRAIGIGHPYSETLNVLADEIPYLMESGVSLVPLSMLVTSFDNLAQTPTLRGGGLPN